jgi:hypothetical protein
MRIEFKLGKTDEQSNTNHMNSWLSVDIQPSSHQFLEFWRSAAEAAACKLIIYMYLSRCMLDILIYGYVGIWIYGYMDMWIYFLYPTPLYSTLFYSILFYSSLL